MSPFSLLNHSLSNTHIIKLPCGGSHTDTCGCVHLEIMKPSLDDLWVCILDLKQSLVCLSLKVLLRLFVNKRRSDDGPAAGLGREVDGARAWHFQSKSGTSGKVNIKVEMLREVPTEMEVANRDSVSWLNSLGNCRAVISKLIREWSSAQCKMVMRNARFKVPWYTSSRPSTGSRTSGRSILFLISALPLRVLELRRENSALAAMIFQRMCQTIVNY